MEKYKKYKIEFRKSVYKELDKIPGKYSKRIYESIGQLADNPFPGNSAKLKGHLKKRRLKVGDYRVLYEVKKEVITIFILKVGHRQSFYQ